MMKRVRILVLTVVLLMALAAPALASYGAVANTKLKLYKKPNLTSAARSVSKYTALVVKETRNGVAKVKYRGETYYVPAKSLTKPWEDLEKKMHDKGIDDMWEFNRYLKEGDYVYCYPKKSASRREVKRDMVVWACYEKNGWTLVECNGYYGYIKSKYLGKKSM